MEEAAGIRLYGNSCLAGDSNVEAAFSLAGQCIRVARILSGHAVDAYGQIGELELCGSAHYRTADGITSRTVHEEGNSSCRCFGRSDVGGKAYATT